MAPTNPTPPKSVRLDDNDFCEYRARLREDGHLILSRYPDVMVLSPAAVARLRTLLAAASDAAPHTPDAEAVARIVVPELAEFSDGTRRLCVEQVRDILDGKYDGYDPGYVVLVLNAVKQASAERAAVDELAREGQAMFPEMYAPRAPKTPEPMRGITTDTLNQLAREEQTNPGPANAALIGPRMVPPPLELPPGAWWALDEETRQGVLDLLRVHAADLIDDLGDGRLTATPEMRCDAASIRAAIAALSTSPIDSPTVMALCEISRLILHAGQTYRFEQRPGCESCTRYAAGEPPHSGGATEEPAVGLTHAEAALVGGFLQVRREHVQAAAATCGWSDERATALLAKFGLIPAPDGATMEDVIG